jgi:MFS superfamily sulfate permease-like transporter
VRTVGADTSGISRWSRPLAGLRGISRADLPREISAGVTLAALVIPLNIGYAQVAGLPATLGLYAAIVPLVLFALLTSSPHVVGGPGPATAALVAAALAGFAAPGDPLRVQFALALALVCSLLFFLAWYFRLGFLENCLSRAVLVGFVSGLGIQVLTNQVRKIMGVSVDTSQQLEKITSQVEKTLGISLKTEGYFLEVSALVREIPHANLFSEEIQKLVKRAPAPVQWFVLDAHAMMEIDITGAEAMRQILALMRDQGVTFAISRAPARLVSRLETYGLLEQIGSNRIYATNREAAAAYYQDQG